MGSKILSLITFATFVVAISADPISKAKPADYYLAGTPGFKYDCSQKEDGDYPHPTKCTHFVACVGKTEAYEMPCATGENGQLLHWVQTSGPNKDTSRCDRPEVAGCDGNIAPTTQAPEEPATTKAPEEPATTKAPEEPATTKAPEEPATTKVPEEPATTQAPPSEGDDCNPEECRQKGECRTFYSCNKQTSKWEKHTCGTDLFWNDAANNGSIHGGNCDFFQNLPAPVQDAYRGDANCILPCAWWKTEGECSGKYHYRVPFDNVTLLNRENELECPSSAGETLVWVQSSLSCERCSEVNDASGNPCC